MSLIDEIGSVPRAARHPNECKVCWLAKQDGEGETFAAVDAALREGAAPVNLASVLARNGYDVSSENLRRHHSKGHTA